MEPIPPTARALQSLSRYGDRSAEEALESLGRVARSLVPECNGISLTVLEDGVSLTLVASSPEVAFLDAMQYLDGGPCVEAVDNGTTLLVNEGDALDEGLWSMFSRASAAAGVACSLSLPIIRDGRVVGGANLYASTRDAFADRQQELADAIGAWAPGAVADADLSFDRRREAQETAQRIADQAEINVAVGIVAESQSVTTAEARRRIGDAATRAGLTELEVARTVFEARGLDL